MCLDGGLADDQFGRNLSVRETPGDVPEHLELARGELIEPRRRLRLWSCELLDQAAGDRRREQGVAAGDRADPGDELCRGQVLEQEAAGACAQRVVDVLVEVEGRKDEH